MQESSTWGWGDGDKMSRCVCMGGLPPPAFVIALYAAEYLPQFTLSSDSKISTLVTLVLLNSAVLGLLCKVEMVVLLA